MHDGLRICDTILDICLQHKSVTHTMCMRVTSYVLHKLNNVDDGKKLHHVVICCTFSINICEEMVEPIVSVSDTCTLHHGPSHPHSQVKTLHPSLLQPAQSGKDITPISFAKRNKSDYKLSCSQAMRSSTTQTSLFRCCMSMRSVRLTIM